MLVPSSAPPPWGPSASSGPLARPRARRRRRQRWRRRRRSRRRRRRRWRRRWAGRDGGGDGGGGGEGGAPLGAAREARAARAARRAAKGGGDGGDGGDDGGDGGGDGGGGIGGGVGVGGVGVGVAPPLSRVGTCDRGKGARMSRRSRTPWTHALVGGASGSYPRGSCQMRRQRARGPNERARDAGGVLGMCGAARRGHGRGGEGAAGVKCGRRAARACEIGPACGRGRCARARAGVGRAARTSSRSRPPRPVDRREPVRQRPT